MYCNGQEDNEITGPVLFELLFFLKQFVAIIIGPLLKLGQKGYALSNTVCVICTQSIL